MWALLLIALWPARSTGMEREETLYALVRHGSLALALRFASEGTALEIEPCGFARTPEGSKTIPASHATPASTPALETIPEVWNPSRRVA